MNRQTQTDRPLLTDGGDRQGRAAPPEDILAAPANQLGTEPHPQDVTQAVVSLLDAAETLVDDLDQPEQYGIDQSAGEVEQLTALAEAVEIGELSVGTESKDRSSSATPDHAQPRGLQDDLRDVRERHTVDSGTAGQLLDDLESASQDGSGRLAATLGETVTELDRHRQLTRALGSLSVRQEPRRLGRELTQAVEGLGGDGARQLSKVGQTLETTADDLETYQRDYRQLAETADEICGTAATQTAWTADTDDPEQAATQLAADLAEEAVWFADESASVARFAASVDAGDAPQSKPSREFLRVLQNVHSVEDRHVTEAITDAVEAIDRTETITTRLDGVDPEAVKQTADRLLSDLSTLSSTVVPHLRERIADIKETAQRSNDADLLTLYASRQELRYYDRTLIPQLAEPTDDDDETGELETQIKEVDDRRSEMRQSYPRSTQTAITPSRYISSTSHRRCSKTHATARRRESYNRPRRWPTPPSRYWSGLKGSTRPTPTSSC
ncbi:hypothetical protein [Halovenus salina]|uniref:Uncharacterized protein n=1 Tax=Halovenus salina TaxID=1510225 RepID=A0ABD5W3I1_9EURY